MCLVVRTEACVRVLVALTHVAISWRAMPTTGMAPQRFERDAEAGCERPVSVWRCGGCWRCCQVWWCLTCLLRPWAADAWTGRTTRKISVDVVLHNPHVGIFAAVTFLTTFHTTGALAAARTRARTVAHTCSRGTVYRAQALFKAPSPQRRPSCSKIDSSRRCCSSWWQACSRSYSSAQLSSKCAVTAFRGSGETVGACEFPVSPSLVARRLVRVSRSLCARASATSF